MAVIRAGTTSSPLPAASRPGGKTFTPDKTTPRSIIGRDDGGRDDAGTRSILDDELLSEPFRQPLSDQARVDVIAARRVESRR